MAGKKLLVADDSLTIQKVIRLALSNEGYEIQAVSDGNDAIQQISLFRPDIVLIDVSLPGKTAFEVKRAINEHSDLEDVRFVLMSSAFESVDEAQAAVVNFHGRLTKPFDPAHLREVLQQVMSQVVARQKEATSLLQRPFNGSPPQLPMDQPAASILQAAAAESNRMESESQNEFGVPTYQPVPPSRPMMQDTDIRQLTESTIRMSGLAESHDPYEWTVQENSLKENGSKLIETATGSFRRPEEPTLAPPTRELPLTPPPKGDYMAPVEISVQGSSTDDMEEIIRRQVEASLERLAQRILPEIAEKVLKKEIHKLLSEQG